MKLPKQYRWLESESSPKMIVEALNYLILKKSWVEMIMQLLKRGRMK